MGTTRRQFLKQTGAGVLGTSLAADRLASQTEKAPSESAAAVDPKEVVAALGNALIPTAEPDYPGYRRLEKHRISDQVWNALRRLDRVTPADMLLFNSAGKDLLGRTFVELDEKARAFYLEMLFASFPPGSFGAEIRASKEGLEKLDKQTLASLQKTLRLSRTRVFTVFYRNFPYDRIDRDENGVPIPSDREHQIIHPKKGDLVTGWDIAGFRGSLSWPEEEERRARFMKVHWHKEKSSD